MSLASIQRAANDPDLVARVQAAANKEVAYNDELANTQYGIALRNGLQTVTALMWPVAVDTEAAYESALQAGRGAPGHDADIITDGAITSAVVAAWPPDLVPPGGA